MAAGFDRSAALASIVLAVAVPAVDSPTAAAGVTPPPSAPAATTRAQPASQAGSPAGRTIDRQRGPATGVGLVAPSSESDEVTRLLLLVLAGGFVLVVLPIQLAKGIAQRRARAAAAPTPLRRRRRSPGR